jgi:hypothetical protein
MSRKSILTALVLCSFALTAAVAQANTILTINNASFETPTLSAGTYYGYTTSGTAVYSWTPIFYAPSVDNPLIMNPGTGWNYQAPYAGNNVGVIAGGDSGRGAWLAQKLTTDGATAFHFGSGDVGGALTMSIYASYRYTNASEPTTGLLHIELWANGAPGTGTEIGDSGPITVSGKPWALETYIYTAQLADVGKDLWIAFHDTNVAYDLNDLTIDVASASFAPVPEPSTLALLTAALIGLLCYAWRKRR